MRSSKTWVAVGIAALAFLYAKGVPTVPTGGGDDGGNSGSSACVAEIRSMDGFKRYQLRHANTIAEVAIREDMRPRKRAVIVALATAMQESGLANLDYGDRDSLGLFQQRSNWGTATERMTPKIAARKFFRALKRVDGWENMPITQAAQAVQVSAFPSAYQQHVPKVQPLADRLLRNC